MNKAILFSLFFGFSLPLAANPVVTGQALTPSPTNPTTPAASTTSTPASSPSTPSLQDDFFNKSEYKLLEKYSEFDHGH